MNSLIRFVVTQRVDHHPDRAEIRDALDQRLIQWLGQAGGLVFPVPSMARGNEHPAHNVNADHLLCWLNLVKPDAIVLSGGNDIGQCPLRDQTEACILDYAQSHIIPVLGICRGMQMMARHAGATLKQCEGHVASRHALSGPQDKAFVLPEYVNSYHSWAVSSCPPGYHTLAMAPDGALEAFRHDRLPWQGWMWHPERESPFADVDLDNLRRLIS